VSVVTHIVPEVFAFTSPVHNVSGNYI